jgi:hypothetical protein
MATMRADARVADMTIAELEGMIEVVVDDRMLQHLQERDQLTYVRRAPGYTPDARTYAEVLASIKRNRWTPPPGAKSSLELLREDRDR